MGNLLLHVGDASLQKRYMEGMIRELELSNEEKDIRNVALRRAYHIPSSRDSPRASIFPIRISH